MGTVCAPPYATIFMGKIDQLLRELAKNVTENTEDPIRLYKRFLDDIFIVWKGSINELQVFLEEINKIHPTPAILKVNMIVTATKQHPSPSLTLGCP